MPHANESLDRQRDGSNRHLVVSKHHKILARPLRTARLERLGNWNSGLNPGFRSNAPDYSVLKTKGASNRLRHDGSEMSLWQLY
jgi:hypothetical protein